VSRLVVDDRIVSIEKLDRTRCVMVDAHSLATIAPELQTRETPTITARHLVETPGGPWLANIIQTIVLNETVVVDSVLFDLDTVSEAYKLFPDIIRGLFIRPGVRDDVGSRVSLEHAGRPPLMSPVEWQRLMLLDSSEKPLFDRIAEYSPRLIPAEYADDPAINLFFNRKRPLSCGMPSHILNSEMTIARAHFYLALASELRLPLSIDPVRSSYLQTAMGAEKERATQPSAHQMLDIFTSKMVNKEAAFVFNVDVPPVAEYVLRHAQRQKISLHKAILEIRDSRRAREFRDWCGKLPAGGQPFKRGRRPKNVEGFRENLWGVGSRSIRRCRFSYPNHHSGRNTFDREGPQGSRT
jgi:hypothetical protein